MSGLDELHEAVGVRHASVAMHSGNIAMRNIFDMIGTWNEGFVLGVDSVPPNV